MKPQIVDAKPLPSSELDPKSVQSQIKSSSSENTPQERQVKAEEFYIFYSFDLTNSTQCKIRYPSLWPSAIQLFFQHVKEIMWEECDRAKIKEWVKVWRLVGDEVLFYQRITVPTDFIYSVPIARNVLDRIIKKIEEQENIRALLSVKATIWCARTQHYDSRIFDDKSENQQDNIGEGECRNLIYKDKDSPLDFLGPDIDTGFRLAEKSTRGRLIVSADLAYLYKTRYLSNPELREKFALSEDPTELMRIVAYEKLKGVWDGRSYPIIWFEKDWKKIPETFHYDDHIEFPFLREIKEKEKKYEDLNVLHRIYKERGCAKQMDNFIKAAEEIKILRSESAQLRTPKLRELEIHCSPICINETGHILIAKRHADKAFGANTWEFGCGQLDRDEKIEDCLIATCKSDFDLTIAKDSRHPFIALKEYSFDDKGRTVPGISFAVYCPNGTELAKKMKHQRIEWVTPENVREVIGTDPVVDDFWQTIDLATKRMQCDWNLQPT